MNQVSREELNDYRKRAERSSEKSSCHDPRSRAAYKLRHEIIMKPGDRLTFEPYEKHWFQAGERGAVLYSFSTTVRDGLDGFTDPEIQRITVVKEKE